MYRGKINGGNLYGKTGSSATRQLGLFVGIYEKKGNRIFFAVELSKNGDDNGPSAQKITENILSEKF